MEYTLTVLFRGLCVYVPGGNTSQVPWFGVFLVNADGNKLDRLDNDPRLNRHFPRILFNLGDLKNPPAGVDGKGILELLAQDIVIKPGSSLGKPLNISHKASEDFDLVPKLSDLLGDGSLLDDCLTAVPTDGHVAARIHLTEGVIFTDATSSFNGNPVTVRFVRQKKNPHDGVIATGVALEMSHLQGDLEVRMRNFDGSNPKAIVLAPGDGKTITLEVLNLCAEEFLSPPPRLPGVDEDFKLNYLVAKAGHEAVLLHDPTLPLPVAIAFDPGQQGGGEYARCTSPQGAPPTGDQLTILMQIASDMGKARARET